MNQQTEMVQKITNSVISTQITLNLLEEIKHTPYFKKELKQKLNLVLPEIYKAEKEHYDAFFDVSDEITKNVYQVFENFIKEISQIQIYDMENILSIISAYKIDPKSINGIVNKINR